jgi:outer membrane receptor protein involved in Fe transport
MKYKLGISLILLLAGFYQVSAQLNGKIVGQVIDSESGEPLTGCNVLIEGTLIGAVSDQDGYFFILNIPPGTYNVSAGMIGYAKDIKEEVKIVSNLTIKLEFRLKSDIITGETVIIEAYRNPLVQKDLTYKIQAVTGEEISRIPITTVNDLLAQQAGITRNILTAPVNSMPVFGQFATIPSDQFHFRGGRENETLYLFDGINVADALWGGYTIDPIGELSIGSMETFSGTYGPEYGDAMSGVVNISTYDQIDLKPKFRLKVFTDNHGLKDESQNSNSYELFLSSKFPSIRNLGLVFSHRSYSSDGYIMGYIYPEYVNSEGTDKSGKPKKVPMQYMDTQFDFGKILWKPFNRLKITIGGYYSTANRGLYNHYFKYNPYGTPRVNLEDDLIYSKVNYSMSTGSYFTMSLANYNRNFKSRVYDNAEAYTIVPQTGSAEFSISGEDWVYFNTHFNRQELNLNYFMQVTKIHSLSAGFTYDKLKTTLSRKNPDGFGVLEQYDYGPIELHGYVGDKMEFEEMGLVVNVGTRMDYINSKRKVLVNLASLSNLNAPLKTAQPILYITPRLGISFPIQEKAAVRFGYGHYYQFPDYFKVFQGTFYVESNQTSRPNPQLENSPIADTDIQPEKTVNYEVGIQNQITNDMGLDITGFYRKTSNLIGVLLNETTEGKRFQVMGNIDYATVKGIEVSLRKHFSHNFSAFFNYTLSKTLVSTSVLFDRPTDEARTFPANWDQPHVFSGNLYLEFKNGFGFSVYGSAASGFPYTRSQFDPNGERAPWVSYLDLNIFKNFKLLGFEQQFFIQILNVIDRKNIWWVYADSGIPGDDANAATSHDYTNDPSMRGPGRIIQLGFKLWNL